eukprot:1095281-Rhodomonas_salina.2
MTVPAGFLTRHNLPHLFLQNWHRESLSTSRLPQLLNRVNLTGSRPLASTSSLNVTHTRVTSRIGKARICAGILVALGCTSRQQETCALRTLIEFWLPGSLEQKMLQAVGLLKAAWAACSWSAGTPWGQCPARCSPRAQACKSGRKGKPAGSKGPCRRRSGAAGVRAASA